jgi:hypothetical protein
MTRVLAILWAEISQLWTIWTAYNPERYYMRGPGPKWRAKHAGGQPPMRIDGSGRIVS